MRIFECKCGCEKSRCVIFGDSIARICSDCGWLHYHMTLDDFVVEVINADEDWQTSFVANWTNEVLS